MVPLSFYLVGSRFFGTHRPNSDWDFVGEDTEESRAYLESLGFVPVPSKYTRYFKDGKDVCLVKNVSEQVRARDILAKEPNIQTMTKAERHAKLMEIIHAIRLERPV